MPGFVTGLLLGSLLTALLVRVLAGYAPRPSHLKHMTAAEVAIVNAVSDVMFPEGGDIVISGRDAGVLPYVDRYMGWHSPATRTAIHLLFFVLEHGTLLFVPSWKKLTQLGEDQRIAYLNSWDQSNLYLRRMVFQSLRAMLCMAYLACSDVERAIGIARPEKCRKNQVVVPA